MTYFYELGGGGGSLDQLLTSCCCSEGNLQLSHPAEKTQAKKAGRAALTLMPDERHARSSECLLSEHHMSWR